jgi:serine/threonine-protein kinase HipA
LGIRRENNFRISVAGAQEKTALLYHDGQWIEPTGTTPTTHIIKPQIGRLPNGMDLSDSVENEYLCLKLMDGFGLRAANVEMAQFGEKKALVVERFDRRWTSDGRLIRLPQEDCCQALSVVPTQKYQNEGGPGIKAIMDLLLGSDEPAKDRYEFFKANVLFWLLGATDGHGKNFSVSILPGGRFRMTPLYDVLTVQPTVDARQIERKYFKLAMHFGKSNHYKVANIVGRHIVETGVQSRLSRDAINSLFEELQDTSEHIIEATFSRLPGNFPEELMASIDGALKARLGLLS